MKINIEVVKDLLRIKNHVVDYFMDLYADPSYVKPKLDGLMFKSLLDSLKEWLERHFEEIEVKKII